MNDSELSPREHAEQRNLVLAGARRIRPVGKYRAQVVSGAVALVLVVAVASGALIAANLFGSNANPHPYASTTDTSFPNESVTPTESPSPTSTPTISPVPSRTPASDEPRVPFGGDCARVVSADAWGAVFDGESPTIADSRINVAMPDMAASTALIGGQTCWFTSSSTPIETATIDVIPADSVADAIITETSSFECDDRTAMCGRAELHDGMWVYAAVSRISGSDPYAQPNADEAAQLAAAVDALVRDVARSSAGDLRGAPRAPSDRSWRIPACDALLSVTAGAAGMTAPEVGWPGDVTPVGVLWDVLADNRAAQWCAWHSNEVSESKMAQFYLQPGVGAPSDPQLEGANAEEVTIPGADAAYLLDIGSTDPWVLVVSGANRLTVRGTNGEAVAAAVLAALNAL